MKKFLLFATLLFTLSSVINAQQKGDWFVGGQLSNTPIRELSIAPMVSYQIDSSWQVGLSLNWNNYNGNYDYTNVILKYYPNNWTLKNNTNNSARGFVAADASTSFEGESYQAGIGVGLTAVFNHWYIEPKCGFKYLAWSGDDAWGLNTSINFGVRF